YQHSYIFAVLKEFNQTHRRHINDRFSIEMEPLTLKELTKLVGTGQPSLHHLGKLVHDRILPHLGNRTEELKETARGKTGKELQELQEMVQEMDRLDIETIIETYLRPASNPSVHNPFVPQPDAPAILQFPPGELLVKLEQVHSGRTTLNLSGLLAEDVLEILYDTRGQITHLEIFNIKDYAFGRSTDNIRIIELQSAINSGNAVKLKRAVRSVIDGLDPSRPDFQEVRQKLMSILCDLANLRNFYRRTELKSRIGTDSTGNSPKIPGMGLVLVDSLGRRGQKQVEAKKRFPIPLSFRAQRRRTYFDGTSGRSPDGPTACRILKNSGFGFWGRRYEEDWVIQESYPDDPARSNIRTIGGTIPYAGNGLALQPPSEPHRLLPSLRYLNSHVKNGLKVLLGFIPAFLTFFLTKEWWVLAYLGAFIWFGITGVRNIIQSVLGAGGIKRSPLLRWNDYVSWDRIADSLLYTGFSVPLLDYFVKTLLMEQTLGVTTATSPILLYTIMALVNGTYISSHNLFRGLPRAAAFGNFFRSILSIPLAVGFNFLTALILMSAGIGNVDAVLQLWAAIISKFASDSVAGVIEGMADRRQNICMRVWDFRGKLKDIYETYARLELMYPQKNVLQMLESPTKFIRTISRKDEELENVVIVNALDMLYFWMYKPRSRHVLRRFLRDMTMEERRVFLLSQYVLQREKEISRLFLDGLVGRDFSRPLAFYLSQAPKYLDDLHKMALKDAPSDIDAPAPVLPDESETCFPAESLNPSRIS
ncbi:MAG: hypothetical protein ACOC0U_06585, partial [Desulfovibrionales bacterium]